MLDVACLSLKTSIELFYYHFCFLVLVFLLILASSILLLEDVILDFAFTESYPFRVKTRLLTYYISFTEDINCLCFHIIPDTLLSHLSPEATGKWERIYRTKLNGSNLIRAFEIVQLKKNLEKMSSFKLQTFTKRFHKQQNLLCILNWIHFSLTESFIL